MKIKPCPKCGYKADFYDNFYHDKIGITIRCKNYSLINPMYETDEGMCGFSSGYYKNEKEAIEEWNKLSKDNLISPKQFDDPFMTELRTRCVFFNNENFKFNNEEKGLIGDMIKIEKPEKYRECNEN